MAGSVTFHMHEKGECIQGKLIVKTLFMPAPLRGCHTVD